ncbi:hypothetical protein BDV28DRAFT_126351 [Aspergillus coremiiformis]|uniref:Ran-interacting Mog1 protein n=1 Tax=Aspergillus coremiiformis TaxID=138285 RepID=A0A5N6ZHA1_9EURO|nr:hypothetical protein BDV28DRAFT_126351 [Aspergillus coremiiformis]
MPTYTTRAFYGGAIKGPTPENWLDASDVREIPDHQEVFLSRTTLTTQIIEINEFVDQGADDAAALYHVRDLCDEDEKLDVVSGPTKVAMGRFAASVSGFRGVVCITGARKGRRGVGSSGDGRLVSTVSVHYLVVRLPEQGTDLVVLVNVPHEEFEMDLGGLEEEERLARGLIDGLVEELEIVDWGLFA